MTLTVRSTTVGELPSLRHTPEILGMSTTALVAFRPLLGSLRRLLALPQDGKWSLFGFYSYFSVR